MTRIEVRYRTALQDLYQRTTQGIKLGLDNTLQLLEAVGSPQKSMKHIVVAGTNGKGSTSSLMAQVLEEAGIAAGLYTSPHLLRYTERIKIRGSEITQQQVLEYYERIRAIEAKCESLPTFFEITTAMALMAFKDAGVEVAVMEVGLGGRLDSTNVVDKFLSIITPIGLDHIHILGETLEEIAAEKAGIIQARKPVVLAPQAPEALQTIESIAADLQSPICHSAVYQFREPKLTIGASQDPDVTYRFDGPAYQACNAVTVFSALEPLRKAGIQVGPEHLQPALDNWRWAGRFQRIQADAPVILDGAHNPHAVQALYQALPPLTERPLHVVFSAVHTKDVGLMVSQLQRQSTSLHLTPSSVGKSLQQDALKELAPDLPVYKDSIAALNAAQGLAQNDGGQVLVTGSLFLVADVLHHLSGESRDPGVVS